MNANDDEYIFDTVESNIDDLFGHEAGPVRKKNEDEMSITSMDGLKDFDIDGDGHITKTELLLHMEKLHVTQQQSNMYRRGLMAAFALFVLFAVTIGVVMFGVIEITKETTVSSDSELVGATMNGEPGSVVKTDIPRSYTVITDIPKLPPKALDALKQLR